MKRFIVITAVLAGILADCRPSTADTNCGDVQANIQRGYDKVLYGKEINHQDYLKVAGALAASAASSSPAPLAAVLKELVDESLSKLAEGIKRELVLEALRNPAKIFTSGEHEISAGFATYQHWQVIKDEVLDRIEIKGFAVKAIMKPVVCKVQLPNTYQPYIRWRKKR